MSMQDEVAGNDDPRYVSRLTKDTLALILAGGRGSRLFELTDWRAKPALYFGGKFRIIDFPLSNCVNSGIRRIGVLTQYKAHSLIRHIQVGWSHFKRELGEYVEVLPASQRNSPNWYQGTADALYQNMDIIRASNPKYVMVLSGDHIYQMDYAPMLAAHVEKKASLTVSCVEVPIAEAAGAFGVMTVDTDDKVLKFTEKPQHPTPVPNNKESCLASMGNYIFDAEFLLDLLAQDAVKEGSAHDFGNDIIPSVIGDGSVYAYRFKDRDGKQAYWRDVGTLDAFWAANMEMISPTPSLNLYDHSWPIWTYQTQLPPAKFVFDDDDRRGYAVDSMVSGGCIISGGTVRHSVLFSDVRVHSFTLIEDSVILPEVEINRDAKIKRAIIDRACIIPAGMEIGINRADDEARGFRVTDSGITLVTPEMLGQRGGARYP